MTERSQESVLNSTGKQGWWKSILMNLMFPSVGWNPFSLETLEKNWNVKNGKPVRGLAGIILGVSQQCSIL